MPQFFFHYRDGVDDVVDHDGRDLADLSEARDTAIRDFRSIVSADAQSGTIDLDARIEISDAAGTVQSTVWPSDAFDIKMPSEASTAR